MAGALSIRPPRATMRWACSQDGADWLDIGGESTRPGAQPVAEGEELERVIPVVQAILAERPDALISIDTMKPAVARAAVEAGAVMWNDVNALRAENARETAASLNCLICLMHMQGEPRTMQADPRYDAVVSDVARFLGQQVGAAMAAGVERDRILLDPGIGFGKTLEHNLELMAGLEHLSGLGFPILFGASRKRFIQAIDASAADASDRLGGSLAAALHAARAGCALIRVHDVRETVQALKVQAAILR
jgi:dihydropteroate synthase